MYESVDVGCVASQTVVDSNNRHARGGVGTSANNSTGVEVDGKRRRPTTQAGRCQRPSPKGDNCKNPHVDGGSYCKVHTCPRLGCGKSKSNTASACPQHTTGAGDDVGAGVDVGDAAKFGANAAGLVRKTSVYTGFDTGAVGVDEGEGEIGDSATETVMQSMAHASVEGGTAAINAAAVLGASNGGNGVEDWC